MALRRREDAVGGGVTENLGQVACSRMGCDRSARTSSSPHARSCPPSEPHGKPHSTSPSLCALLRLATKGGDSGFRPDLRLTQHCTELRKQFRPPRHQPRVAIFERRQHKHYSSVPGGLVSPPRIQFPAEPTKPATCFVLLFQKYRIRHEKQQRA